MALGLGGHLPEGRAVVVHLAVGLAELELDRLEGGVLVRVRVRVRATVRDTVTVRVRSKVASLYDRVRTND